MTELSYQTGFGNTLESECLPNALPKGRNNPRRVPYDAYAEQISGTAFTAPRRENRRTWLYRKQPSVVIGDAETGPPVFFGGCSPQDCRPVADALRWNPLPVTEDSTIDFVDGMKLMCASGDTSIKSGLAIYMYTCRASMTDRHLCNTDGEFLIVPQLGRLEVWTEMGRLQIEPQQILVIPRGIVFQVHLLDEAARGYVLEVYSHRGFQLPELGPIGSNGLANARDFEYPVAWCQQGDESASSSCQILYKIQSQLFRKRSDHSPYNVIAWHGNYLPYRYDLRRFCAVNSVSYDHLDPSIYTVLTCPSEHPGTALADFVIFPPRLMATDENTLRPPWFHRNCMSEYMGLIVGQYDAKEGFAEGGASLHNCMLPHGPDVVSYKAAVEDPCEGPSRLEGTMAFMFETCQVLKVAPQTEEWRDAEYTQCWKGL